LLVCTVAGLFLRWFTLRLWGTNVTLAGSLLLVAAGLWGFGKLDPAFKPSRAVYSIDKDAFEALVAKTNAAIETGGLVAR
jgi:hypothetical protein